MLIDGFGRKIDYLRISVTDRCNFRCLYCVGDKPFSWVPHGDILTYEELFMFVKTAIDEGVTKIRVTGGEPLVRPHLDAFIKMISDYKKDVALALTTNGYFLEEMAQKLAEAGLKRINISLDSLKKETIYKISKIDALSKILIGIDKSLEAGLVVKINMVPLYGVNDDEVVDLLEYAKSKGIMMRYIEYMENSFAQNGVRGLSADTIRDILRTKYNFKEIPKDNTSPASLYELEDGYRFGIIAPHKHDFCESCNRLRLSAEGMLIPCLYFDEALSIKEALRAKDLPKAVEILRAVLKNKPESNRWAEGVSNETSDRAFYQTGG